MVKFLKESELIMFNKSIFYLEWEKEQIKQEKAR